MAGTGANSVPLGPLHPALRGQKSGGGSGESMLNAARLAAARVTANLKVPNSNMPEMKQERPVAAAYRPFPDAGDSMPSKRRKRSRWGGDEKAPVPSLIPSGISADQEKQVLLHLKIEDLSRKLRSGDLGIPPNPEDRSPSPEPIYDHNGKRLNTREYRTRKKLEEERHIAVQEALTINPEYKPPADYKPPVQKVSDRVMIPQDDHPHINFVGLLIGPRGNTLKKLEKDTGTKIMIRGKGSVKEGKVGRKDGQPLPGEDEPLHALVTASNAEAVKKAVDQITQTIKEGIEQPEGQNDLRRKQLRELAKLNGTLREEDMLRCSNCGATDHRTWQCPEKQNVTSNVLCGICGAAGHVTADCRQKANIESPFSNNQPAGQQPGGNMERAKMDSEYMSFMAELGEGPPQSQSERAGNQQQQPPASGPPPVNPPSLLQPPVSQTQNGSGQSSLGSSQNNQGPNNVGPNSNQDDRPPFTRRSPYDRNSFGSSRGPGGTSDDRGSYNDSFGSGSSQYRDNYQSGSQYGDSPRPFRGPRPLMGSQSPYSWRRDRNEDRGNQFGGPPPRRYPPPFNRRGPGGAGGPPPRGMGPGGPMPPRGPPPPGPAGIPPLMSMPPNMGPPSGMGQPRPPVPPLGYMGGPPQLGGPVGPPMNVPWGNAGGMPPVPPSSQQGLQPTAPSSQTSTSVASVAATTSTAQPVPPPPSMVAQPPPPPPSSDPQPAPPAPPGGQPFQAANNAGAMTVSSGGVSLPTQSPWQQMQQQQSVSMATSQGVSIAPPASTSAPMYPWQTAAAALEAMAAGRSQPSLPTSSAAASSAQKTSTTTTTAASTSASTVGVSMAPPTQPAVPQMAPMMGMGQMPQWSQMMYPAMGMGMGMGMMPGMGQMGMMMPPQPSMGAPMMPQPQQPMVSQGQQQQQQQQQTSTAMPFQPPPPPIDSNQMASLVSAPPPPPPPP